MYQKILLLLSTIFFFSTLLYADGDDISITVSNAPSVYENDGTATFTINLSEKPDFCTSVTVNFKTENGSAKSESDYEAKEGSVTFYGFCPNPLNAHIGSKSETVDINIIDDSVYEYSEYFYLRISNSTIGYDVTDYSGNVYIYNDDQKPIILQTFKSINVNEQDSDRVVNALGYFNQAIPSALTVTYHTENGTAISGLDYQEENRTITVSAGNYVVFVPVTIKGDLTPEVSKNFKIIIDSISDGTVTDNQATVNIEDDDNIEVDVHCDDATEGDDVLCKIYLKKNLPAGEDDLTINYQSEDGSEPSAKAGIDYTAVHNSVTFKSGEKEKIVKIPTIQDTIIEPDEKLRLIISGSSYIIDTSSTAEIINDDGDYPTLSFSTTDFYTIEGNASEHILNFTFNLSSNATVEGEVSFEYYTSHGDTDDADYKKISLKKYTISTGESNITIPVTIKEDKDIENDETFYLKIINEEHLNVAGHTAKGHIINDDGSYPLLSCTQSSVSITEGDSGEKTLTYLFTLDKESDGTSQFNYDTWDDDEDDKDEDERDDKDSDGDDDDDDDDDNEDSEGDDRDYEIVPKTLYSIESNESELNISVIINGDRKIERDEIFYLSLYNPVHLTIDSNCRSIETTIINDDGDFPEFSIDAPIVKFVEQDSNKTLVSFNIRLDKPAKEDNVSIEYTTSNGTAKSSDYDYEEIEPTVVTFNSGEQNKTFSTYINGDTKVEDNETFFIKLLNPYRATLSNKQDRVEITIINDDQHSNEPFTCNSSMYISSSTNRETGARGRMWLHTIETSKNPFEFYVIEDEGANELYNATAYNPDDNYIYGLYHRELIKLTKTGKVINIGTITALPSRFDDKQLYAGAISNGYYYVSGRTTRNNQLFRVKLSDLSVTDINLSKDVAIQDFSFYKNVNDSIPDNTYLYGVDKDGKLTKIDVRDGTVTQIGSDHIGFEFDSSFSDKTGRFFANDSNGNGFFEFNLVTGEKNLISNSQSATFNDGANCINAELVFNDYGDAPMRYQNTWHTIANGIYLGDKVDHDVGSYDSEDADGDDNNGEDDDDGITFLDGTDIDGGYFELNKTQQLKVKISKEAYLRIWIDTQIDGIMDNGHDLVYSSRGKLSAGVHTINFTLPANLTKNRKTYLRARVSSNPSMNSTGFGQDGEVEDYLIYFGSAFQPLRGVFNIERTNSGKFPINSNNRNAWYTQVVGRDFDYSILFYKEDMSAEQTVSNLTFKVELVDRDHNNSILYERYFHIPSSSTQSRFDISHINHNAEADDLSEQSKASLPSIPASRDVYFRVSYQEDSAGNIIQSDCEGITEADYKTCYNTIPASQIHQQPAKDNFAIRPKGYYLSIYDGGIALKKSIDSNNSLRVASGYDYNLTIIATDFNTINPTKGFDGKVIRKLEFKDSSSCHNRTSPSKVIQFDNGNFNDQNFTHHNVGHYQLKIIDDNNWSYVDSHKNDCNNNSLTPAGNGEEKIGCNIIQPSYNIHLNFYPYQFSLDDVNFSVLPIDDNEFIYMDSELNHVGVQLIGNIVAQNAQGEPTTNFTATCGAEKVALHLDVNITSDTGFNTPLKTTPDKNGSRLDVNFNRSFAFNNSFTTSENNISNITSPITIRPIDFRETNSSADGKVKIDLRYNISKNIKRTINPIKIGFKKLVADSFDAHTYAKQSNNWIPKGSKEFNEARLFYFTQVVSDTILYPRVNFIGSPVTVNTPISVDIFCQELLHPEFCKNMAIFENTHIYGSPRKEKGWYISINHNPQLDGNISSLNSLNSTSLTVNPSNNIPFKNGQNYAIISTVQDKIHTLNRVEITLPSQLKYLKPFYLIPVIGHNASEWSGIGEAGNLLSTKPNTDKSDKSEW